MNPSGNQDPNYALDGDNGGPERTRRFSISETIGRMYKDGIHPVQNEPVKKLGDYIRFSNEGKLTKAEQRKRDIKLYETSGYQYVPDYEPPASSHGEVIGTISDVPNSRATKKGLEVSLVNGQIVLDRSSITRQVDHFDMNDSDDDLSDFSERNRKGRHKVVVWTVEETKQFYDCLRRFGTDFFMMNKVITNRTRKELKNKFKTEERRNAKLVGLILAVHLKEKMVVPEVEKTNPKPSNANDSNLNSTNTTNENRVSLIMPPSTASGNDENDENDENDDNDDNDELSESSEEMDSEDDLMVGDML